MRQYRALPIQTFEDPNLLANNQPKNCYINKENDGSGIYKIRNQKEIKSIVIIPVFLLQFSILFIVHLTWYQHIMIHSFFESVGLRSHSPFTKRFEIEWCEPLHCRLVSFASITEIDRFTFKKILSWRPRKDKKKEVISHAGLLSYPTHAPDLVPIHLSSWRHNALVPLSDSSNVWWWKQMVFGNQQGSMGHVQR
jgi:hypothetical protein